MGGLARRSLPGFAIAAAGAAFLFRGATGYCALYESIGLDTNWDTSNADRSSSPLLEATRVAESAEVNEPAAEWYAFWRHLENLARIMSHLRSGERINDRVSHGVVNTIPGAPNMEWDTEITHDVPNEPIAWRSLKDGMWTAPAPLNSTQRRTLSGPPSQSRGMTLPSGSAWRRHSVPVR